MSTLHLFSLAAVYSPFAHFAQEYVLLFVLAIITFVLCIALRSYKFFLAQLSLVIAVFLINEFMVYDLSFMLTTIQILFTVTVLYVLKKAVDYNYLLILEKTHQTPRNITKDSYNGSRSSF